MQRCSKCGTKLSDEDKMCTFCGASLGILEMDEEIEEIKEAYKNKKSSLYDEFVKLVFLMLTKPASSISVYIKEMSNKLFMSLITFNVLIGGVLLLWFAKGIYSKLENIITAVPLLSNFDSLVHGKSLAIIFLYGAAYVIIIGGALGVGTYLISRFMYNSKCSAWIFMRAVALSFIISLCMTSASLLVSYLSIQLGIVVWIAGLLSSSCIYYFGVSSNIDISQDEAAISLFWSYILNLIILYVAVSITIG